MGLPPEEHTILVLSKRRGAFLSPPSATNLLSVYALSYDGQIPKEDHSAR